ncbi:aldo/keto reductase [Rhodovulum sp. DZ06]|uniref:aldo/keto reductase n=1 Tax=Rhodovulum sp. DZ06 TaxID=3425126 RepID=UPI003D3518E8
MIRSETYTLSNGVEIPKLGLGVWMIEDDATPAAVKAAVDAGYRHVDTAQAYANEAGTGRGVREAGVARDALFVTTKLDAGIKSYAEAVAAIDGSLKTLGLDVIDMMIIHSPQPWRNFGDEDRFFDGNLEAWRALEEAHAAGKLRAIGVSNFQQEDLQNLFDNASVKPMVNQVLAHVSNTPAALIDFCQSNGVLVEAYSPIGHGEVLKNEKVGEMAATYGVSIPQLCIRYLLQLGLLPLPKSATPAHIAANAEVDFEISAADMQALKEIETIKDYGEHSVFPVYGGKM